MSMVEQQAVSINIHYHIEKLAAIKSKLPG
jgi:hypothetical protein